MTHRSLAQRCTGRYFVLGSTLALTIALLLAAAAPVLAQSRARDRIVEPVDREHFSVMRGHLRPGLTPETDLGALPENMPLGGVTMFFRRTSQQQADLDTLLAQQQDPSSANFHRWLTPEEFGDRFGLTQGDVDKIIAWLQSQGLTVLSVSRSRSWVTFSGSVQQVQAALRTELHSYAVSGETHFAATREPSVPSSFAGVVMGVRGIDDFRMKPHAVKAVDARFTSGQSGSNFVAPEDFATIYHLAPLYSANIDGTGQTVVVVGQTAINVSDVDTFRSLSGLPVNHPQVILVPQSFSGAGDPGIVAGDIDEANLDLDWVGAVARRANIKYVYAGSTSTTSGVIAALAYSIDFNLAPVVSISYGNCEGGTSGFSQAAANSLASLLQAGNAQGITIVAPAGDNGAADCDSSVPVQQGLSIDLPGGSPYATSVGGTEFSADSTNQASYWSPKTTGDIVNSAIMYIPETSWNDTTSSSSSLHTTGGGMSRYFPKPSWQTGLGVPSDGARDVPDISFNASPNHDGYLACTRTAPGNTPTCVNGFRTASGNLSVFGGTSAGVPIFAGIVALINQFTQSSTGQGNIGYVLYPLAGNFPAAFHDVTSGNNMVPCQTSPPSTGCPTSGSNVGFLGFSASAGYDLVTGLGSIDAFNLVTAWPSVSLTSASEGSTAPDFQVSLSTPRLSIPKNSSATAQVTIIGLNGFAGPVNVNCIVPTGLTGTTCAVTGTGNTHTLTITNSNSASVFPQLNFPSYLLAIVLLALLGIYQAAFNKLRWAIRWPRVAVVLLLLTVSGCGGGGGNSSSNASNSTSTPTSVQSANIVVQATSGSITHTAQLAATIN